MTTAVLEWRRDALDITPKSLSPKATTFSNQARTVVTPVVGSVQASDMLIESASQSAFVLLGEIAPGCRIVTPLRVTQEQDDDGSFIISDDLFAVYGAGTTPEDAEQDYIISLLEYYELLAERAKTQPETNTLFQRLKLYLRASNE